MRRFAAALSRHPLASHAVGEIIGEVMERLGSAPSLAVVVVGGEHRSHTRDIAEAIEHMLQPSLLVGAGSSMVAGNRREVEGGAAIALFAASIDGVHPVRLAARRVDGGVRLSGLDPVELNAAHSMMLMVDPFSFPTAPVLSHLNDRHPQLTVLGGLVSGARQADESQLVIGGEVHADGAVGFVLDGRTRLDPLVSPGCRPIGSPFTVTRADANMVDELAGRSATDVLADTLRELDPADRALATTGLSVGRVINESNIDHGPGDFVIRGVMGLDRSRGAIAVGDTVPVGSTLQFQVRDADSALTELATLLARTEPAEAALLFTCTGRGTHLFGDHDQDAGAISDAFDDRPLIGMSCAGEIGPIGPDTHLHGFTASIGLFRTDSPA